MTRASGPRKISRVSWKDAKVVADQWAIDAGFTGDLHGKMLIVPAFADDEDCRFFLSDRSFGFHRMVIQAVQRTARKAGAKVVPVELSPKDYRAWLRAGGLQDSAEQRTAYLAAQTKLV